MRREAAGARERPHRGTVGRVSPTSLPSATARACFEADFDMAATAAKTLEIFRELVKTGA